MTWEMRRSRARFLEPHSRVLRESRLPSPACLEVTAGALGWQGHLQQLLAAPVIQVLRSRPSSIAGLWPSASLRTWPRRRLPIAAGVTAGRATADPRPQRLAAPRSPTTYAACAVPCTAARELGRHQRAA